MQFRVRIHQYGSEKLVAVCDSELINMEFEHNGVLLKVLPRFYGTLDYSAEEVLTELQSATSYNVIGENICHLLVQNGFIHPKTIIWFEKGDQKIGHAIVVR